MCCLNIFSACSHMGRVRTNNEDNLFCNGITLKLENRDFPFFFHEKTQEPCIFAVCDGMGGEDCGELASSTVVNTLAEHAEKIKTSPNIDEAVLHFISDSNKKLCEIMKKDSIRLGTTLALAVISNNSVKAYNIGDSRIYKFHDKQFLQISEDHTIAAQKIKMGLLTNTEAQKDKSRHILTRYIGIFEEEMILTPNIIPEFKINQNDKLLLCSDGLTEMVTEKYIASVLEDLQDSDAAVNGSGSK